MEPENSGINNKEILDVRKVIERSTSKVSLRDLEKKGFRQVKVLRAGDINQLIYKAVQTVLAKNPVGGGAVSEAERERILEEARQEYEKQLKAAQAANQAINKLEEEKARLEAEKQASDARQAEAMKRLEQKVAEINAQNAAKTRAFESEKARFEQEKQALFEKGIDAAANASRIYEPQLQELKQKLDEAERRAASAQGAVSEEAYKDLETRAKDLESRARGKVEALERELRTVRHDAQMAKDDEAKQRGRAEELESEVSRLRDRSRDLEVAAGKAEILRGRINELESEQARLRAEPELLREKIISLEGELGRTRGENEALRAKVAELESTPKADSEEMARLREELAASEAKSQEMFAAVIAKLNEAPKQVVAAQAAGTSPDIEKQLKSFAQGLTDQMRKIAGSNQKGGGFDGEVNLAGISLMGEDVKLETNISDVAVKQQSAQGVKDKLSKLKSMRGGGGPK